MATIAATLATAAASAAPYIAAAGTAMSAVGAIQQGRAASASAKFEAQQMRQRADAERASSQREALEKRRQFDLAQGAARAKLGASGAGLASTTPVNILSGLEYESDLAYETSISEGLERAKGFNLGASSREIEGRNARRAGYTGAFGEIASFAGSRSAQSLYENYAPKDNK